MKAKHTQGEWEVRTNSESPEKEIFVAVKGKDAIAILFDDNSTVNSKETALANAKIMASGQTLLKALVALKIKYLFNQTKTQAKNNHIDETLLEVEEAIKKATE